MKNKKSVLDKLSHEEKLEVTISFREQARIISALEMKVEVYQTTWSLQTHEEYKALIKKFRDLAEETLFGSIENNNQPKKSVRSGKKQNGKNKKK